MAVGENNNPPWVPLAWGRPDLGEGVPEDKPPGGGHGGHDAVKNYFLQHFGFRDEETAIILGAHTLVRDSPVKVQSERAVPFFSRLIFWYRSILLFFLLKGWGG